MNRNPTLLLDLALSRVAGAGDADRAYAELRLYPGNSAGYFFVRQRAPGRWYWLAEAGADHFNRARQAEVDEAIEAGARVQLVGNRGRSLRLWRSWEEFASEAEMRDGEGSLRRQQ